MTTNTHRSIVVGVFSHAAQTKGALDALQRAGFSYEQIGVAMPEQDTVDLRNDLQNFNLPGEHASYYTQEFQSGHIIVSVRPDGRNQEASAILRSNGAYDFDHRTPAPQATTANGRREESSQRTTSPTMDTTSWPPDKQNDFYQPRSLKLRGEQLNVTKEQVQSGEVELHKEVVTEQKTFTVPVSHEEVVVERHAPTAGQLDSTPIGEEEILRIPVREEQINVTRQTVVTGEVSVGKRTVEENKQVTESVQHEEERIEHEGNVSDLTMHEAPSYDKREQE